MNSILKKIIQVFIAILIIYPSFSFSTDEIISSQMETLNLSSLMNEGEKYTEDIFPDINLNDLLNSAIKGEVDNKSIYKGVLSIFGNEIVSSISLLGSILIIIIIHSLLKSFTENLSNKEGIGQIAYYIEYILIVTLVMANFSNIINMIKESIANLVGFVNSLVPILLALMSATRKYCISYSNTTINNIFNCIHSKYYNDICTTTLSNRNCFRNNI